jgi:hypothetical protein
MLFQLKGGGARMSITLPAILLLGCILTGCVSTGAKGVAVQQSEYQVTYSAPFEKTWKGVLAALRTHNVHVFCTRTGSVNIIEGRSQEGSYVQVVVDGEKPGVTAVTVKTSPAEAQNYGPILDDDIRRNTAPRRQAAKR